VNARRVTVVFVGVGVFYLLVIWRAAVDMLTSGYVLVALFGGALLVLPFVYAWFVWRAVQRSRAADRLGENHVEQGAIPVNDPSEAEPDAESTS
jgi:hypothetical protein